jgi:glycosyltransferase involved in cell wall biosynthesis
MDDGSTDHTDELVSQWISEGEVDIQYYYKPNGGMHTARNAAYEKVKTLLNVIIDSDDWMTDNAVELIVDFWSKNGSNQYSGIITNNISTKGEMIGSPMPANLKSCRCHDLFEKYGVKGDKKLIFRSDLTKLYPYPEFPGEKFYPASYKFRLLDQDYEMLIMHEFTCVVDYNADSMTFHKFAQYKSCCQGFSHYRNEMIRLSNEPKYIVKQMLHYIAESKMANKRRYIRESSKPVYAILCLPFGLAYYSYLSRTKKKY